MRVRITSILAAVLVAFLIVGAAFPSTAFAIKRIYGSDRYGTAAAAAAFGSYPWSLPPSDTWGVVATGENWPDALCSGGLAGAVDGGKGGPLLLVTRTSVPAPTLGIVRDFGIKKVYVIGGTSVVSEQVVSQLRSAGVSTVVRIAGKDRYYTSAMIAAEIARLRGSTSSYVFVASGENFPDALAATPLSVAARAPILLTKQSSLPSPVAYELNNRRYPHAYIIGGTGPVSSYVAGQVPNLRGRLAGTDRYGTALRVGSFGISTKILDGPAGTANGTGVANFRSFPDALSGGHACGRVGYPLLGTETGSVPGATRSAFPPAEGEFGRNIYVFGGPGVVNSTAYAVLSGLVE